MKKILSVYCQTVCEAQCCKRGKLPLLKEENSLFSDPKRINENNFYDLIGGCEHLDGVDCTIYETRPQMCRKYPYVDMGPLLLATTSCPAVEEGIMDEDIKEKKARKL